MLVWRERCVFVKLMSAPELLRGSKGAQAVQLSWTFGWKLGGTPKLPESATAATAPAPPLPRSLDDPDDCTSKGSALKLA